MAKDERIFVFINPVIEKGVSLYFGYFINFIRFLIIKKNNMGNVSNYLNF